jgi:hypothetical protein
MSSDLLQRIESTSLAAWQARLIEKSATILATFVESTREDRLRWQPSVEENSKTRSVLEQVGECIFANRRFSAILSGQPVPTAPAVWDEFVDGADAVAKLKESAAALSMLVAKMDSEALARDYPTHRGPMPGILAIQFPVRNMTYHMGQINMIQLLYGDTEFHITDEFTTL